MKRTIALLIISLLSLLNGCVLKATTLPELYKDDLDDVTKVVIVDGSTGSKKTVTDPEIIEEFLNEIKEIIFIPQENLEKRDGWRYSISLFNEEDQSFQFGTSEVNGHYYDTEPDLLPIVEDFYENLNVAEE